MDWSSTALRVLRAVAETGSFTAAAAALGYTQSAVSRQMAGLERSAGAPLFRRQRGGVRLTEAGTILLRHASAALDEVDAAAAAMSGADPVRQLRLGVITSLGAVLVPDALRLLRHRRPTLDVQTREGSTPALVRGLRAGTLDLGLISSRTPYAAPDDLDPPLELEVLLEGDLVVAVPAGGRLGRDGSVTLAELEDATWITSPPNPAEPALGVWPALRRRPTIGHQSRDWLTKLTLVAGGWGVTTLPPYLSSVVPDGVRLAQVSDSPPVRRRLLLARGTGASTDAADDLARCLREAAAALPLA